MKQSSAPVLRVDDAQPVSSICVVVSEPFNTLCAVPWSTLQLIDSPASFYAVATLRPCNGSSHIEKLNDLSRPRILAMHDPRSLSGTLTSHSYAGESGLGKTTLINTLFSTELSSTKNYSKRHQKQLDKLTEVEIIKAELEEKQFKTKLTVIDTPGFGDYVNNRDSWAPIVDFIDDQHEAYMRQEQQPERKEKIDLRVHACLYFIRPTGHT